MAVRVQRAENFGYICATNPPKRIFYSSMWSIITVDQYREASRILADETLSNLNKNIHLIAITLDMSLEKVRAMPTSRFKEMVARIAFLTQPIDVPMELARKFKLRGKQYWVSFEITQLTAGQQEDISGIVAGQYIDAQDSLKRNSAMAEAIPKLLSIVCLPMKRKGFKKVPVPYDGKIAERENELKYLPFGVAYPIAVFFYNVWRELTGDLLHCTKEEMALKIYRLLKSKDFKGSTTNGDGL